MSEINNEYDVNEANNERDILAENEYLAFTFKHYLTEMARKYRDEIDGEIDIEHTVEFNLTTMIMHCLSQETVKDAREMIKNKTLKLINDIRDFDESSSEQLSE